MGLKQNLHTLKMKYKGTKMAPAFNAIHTFLYLPNETTHNGTHIKAADDLKRTMNMVIMSLVPCLLFGIFNAGYQYNVQTGDVTKALSFLSTEFWNFSNFTIQCSNWRCNKSTKLFKYRVLELLKLHYWSLESLATCCSVIRGWAYCGIYFCSYQRP